MHTTKHLKNPNKTALNRTTFSAMIAEFLWTGTCANWLCWLQTEGFVPWLYQFHVLWKPLACRSVLCFYLALQCASWAGTPSRGQTVKNNLHDFLFQWKHPRTISWLQAKGTNFHSLHLSHFRWVITKQSLKGKHKTIWGMGRCHLTKKDYSLKKILLRDDQLTLTIQ